MRPRKSILLYTDSPVNASVLKLVLETRGKYRVIPIFEADVAIDLLRGSSSFDMLVAELAALSVAANEVAREAKIRFIPTLIFSCNSNDYDRAMYADHFIPEMHCNSEEMLLRIGILIQRKRGPKKAAA